jgi:hypothetical protein
MLGNIEELQTPRRRLKVISPLWTKLAGAEGKVEDANAAYAAARRGWPNCKSK